MDHTLLRHIGAEGDYRHENRGSMEENVSAMSMPRSGSDSYVSSDGDLSVRRREPTPEERIALREEMFSFFETSRQTENSMVDYTLNFTFCNHYIGGCFGQSAE